LRLKQELGMEQSSFFMLTAHFSLQDHHALPPGSRSRIFMNNPG
jgi:hypothetical protein